MTGNETVAFEGVDDRLRAALKGLVQIPAGPYSPAGFHITGRDGGDDARFIGAADLYAAICAVGFAEPGAAYTHFWEAA